MARSAQRGSSRARDARANPAIDSAFHAVRILSSRPGRTRFSRASNSAVLAPASLVCASGSEIDMVSATRASGSVTRRCHAWCSKFGGWSKPK